MSGVLAMWPGAVEAAASGSAWRAPARAVRGAEMMEQGVAAVDEPLGRLGFRIGRLAVVQVRGGIDYGPESLPSAWILDSLAAAAASRAERVVLEVDCPGGSSPCLGDLIEEMSLLTARKPVTAIAHHTACSLAIPFLAMATEASVTPTGRVGSIGAIVATYDDSAAMARAGVVPHIITDALHKTLGRSGAEVTEAHLDAMRAEITTLGSVLVGAVVTGRRVPAATVRGWQGRVFLGEEARAAGLVDRVETQAGLYRRIATEMQS